MDGTGSNSKRIVTILLIGLILIIGIFLYFYHDKRSKSSCHLIENEANEIAAAIYNYFDAHGNKNFPQKNDLAGLDGIKNRWEIVDTENEIYIRVTDSKSICDPKYKEAHPDWSGEVYTQKIDKKEMFKALGETQ